MNFLLTRSVSQKAGPDTSTVLGATHLLLQLTRLNCYLDYWYCSGMVESLIYAVNAPTQLAEGKVLVNEN